MKKLSTQNIRHLKTHSKKQSRNKLRRKNKSFTVKIRRKTIPSGLQYRNKPSVPVFQDVIAPEKFNLKAENCNDFLDFINKLKKIGQNQQNVNLIMSETTEVGEGAICMLLSVLDELMRNGTIIRGTKPNPGIERDILEKSGFFKYFNGLIDAKNKNSKNTILRTGGVSLTHIDLSDEIKKANETVWGEKGRNPPLRGTVFEMMRNSCDHAFKKDKNVIWHFGISHDEDNKQVKFSFVDNGRGIIRSFTEGIFSKFLNLFTDNTDLLETAFKDGIESRTGLSWRGKGLPTIYENYEESYLKNLVVISNDVYIDFDRKIHKKLSVPFAGTYYFWVLNEECSKACYN